MFSFFYCSKYVFLALQIDTLLACGGLAKNPLFLQEHADIVGLSLSLSLFLTHACTHTHNGYTLLTVKLHMGLMYFYLQQLARHSMLGEAYTHTHTHTHEYDMKVKKMILLVEALFWYM